MKSTILVVDDEPSNLEVIAEILQSMDVVLLFAPDATKALEIASKKKLDAIIMDWDMPEINGIEATKLLQQDHRTEGIPVIIATGKIQTEEDLLIAIDAGAMDFVRKPVSEYELVARLKSALKISRSFNLIKSQNQAIQASLNYAVDIQRAMLPKNEDIANYFDKHFVLDQPKEIIKGDVYWLRSNLNGEVLFALIDSGPSVSGALLSTMINLSLQRIIDENGFLQAHIILEKIHKLLSSEFGSQKNHPKTDVRLSVCLFNYHDNTLQFAGSRSSVCIFKSSNMVELHGDPQDLADQQWIDDRDSFKSYKVRYQKGDRVYMISNGLENQAGGEYAEQYGFNRVRELLTSIQNLPFQNQEISLGRELKRWRDQAKMPQQDDLMVIGIEM